jgi:SAM-dependent methyltransferase
VEGALLAEKVAASRTFLHLRERFGLGERSVLDIGCSEGHYLRHFGPGSVGITLIEEHIAQARAMGLTVLKANIEDPNFSLPQQFDVVWANNLFEHMNAPHLFLMKVRELLKKEGLFILGAPVIPHVPGLATLKKFRGAYAVSHVNFFTRRTLIETVRAAGWVVEEARLFYFKSYFLDTLLNVIVPHVYIVARPDPSFMYAEKRIRSLREYNAACL